MLVMTMKVMQISSSDIFESPTFCRLAQRVAGAEPAFGVKTGKWVRW
jgi:hypothetical protein